MYVPICICSIFVDVKFNQKFFSKGRQSVPKSGGGDRLDCPQFGSMLLGFLFKLLDTKSVFPSLEDPLNFNDLFYKVRNIHQ